MTTLVHSCIAVTVGSAAPHLINALRPIPDAGETLEWRPLVVACSVVSAVGGVLAAIFLRQGPHKQHRKRARWSDLKELATNKQYLYATAAYLGHNWEIYAYWSWARQFAAGIAIDDLGSGSGSGSGSGVAQPQSTYDGAWRVMHPYNRDRGAALVAFVVVGVGFFGCFVGGYIADRHGRVPVCISSLAISGIASLVIGDVQSPGWVVVLGIVWGFTVVSDSAQYSTIVTEVVDPKFLGTAMTAQFGFGYLTTFPSIYLVPAVVEKHGWGWGWRLLAPGSVVAIVALVQLYRLQAVDGKNHRAKE